MALPVYKTEISDCGVPLGWPRDTLYPLKLALTSPTSGGCMVGIVRLRTIGHAFFWYYYGSIALCWAFCLFFCFFILYTVGRTLWKGAQPVAKPLPTHRIKAQNADLHTLSEIRTHDPSVRTSKDSSCLRPRGHWDWQVS
jgi:hypothetical protein